MYHHTTIQNTDSSKVSRIKRVIFLLLPGFSALDLSSGVEALQTANGNAGEDFFELLIVSESGEATRSNGGFSVAVDGGLPESRICDLIVVCGPLVSSHRPSKTLAAWLRRSERFGARLCCLGGGVIVLGYAGLLSGKTVSAHWILAPVISEIFPEVDVNCSIYELDNSLISCGGGASTMDLFLLIVSQQLGSQIAAQTADQLLQLSIRLGSDSQTVTTFPRAGVRSAKLAKALTLISENLEIPLSPSEIAGEVGVSTRQLERLFNRELRESPKSYITGMRLERARLMLQMTQNRILDVALACGFTSASHFSKLYRRKFGTTPYTEQEKRAAFDIP